MGLIGFDGHLNTGMTLRTIRIRKGVAEVRAGATLLYDSVPEDEEKETELKASAFVEAVLVNNEGSPDGSVEPASASQVASAFPGSGVRVLFVDHQDSFVHTLANYFRQTGAEVTTMRFGTITAADLSGDQAPHLAVMSPGPGNPKDFACSDTLQLFIDHKIPVFGVCLGLQAMIEHFGGELGVLDYPQHGKPATVQVKEGASSPAWNVFEGLGTSFGVARYHSLYGLKVPDVLRQTAFTSDGVLMAIEHKMLPMAAVQFHPESILTNPRDGLRMLSNVVSRLRYAE